MSERERDGERGRGRARGEKGRCKMTGTRPDGVKRKPVYFFTSAWLLLVVLLFTRCFLFVCSFVAVLKMSHSFFFRFWER